MLTKNGFEFTEKNNKKNCVLATCNFSYSCLEPIYLHDKNFSVVSVALFTTVAVETDKLFDIVGVLVGNAVAIFWLTLASAIVAKNNKRTGMHVQEYCPL